MDGTLLNEKGVISAEDTAALAKTCASGIKVSLSTGRVTQGCSNILDQLSLDGCHIFFDGALVANPRISEEIYVEPISPELVREAIDFSRQNDLNFDLYTSSHFYIERETWASEIRRRFFWIEPTVIDFNLLSPQERIIKGTLVVSSPEEKAKAESFHQHFGNRLGFSITQTPAYPEVWFVNIVAPAVSKGKALKALASHLEIDLSQVAAIGDGGNDVSLLSNAGLAIAMGNATDEVKAVADHVTLDVSHSGVAAAVHKFLL